MAKKVKKKRKHRIKSKRKGIRKKRIGTGVRVKVEREMSKDIVMQLHEERGVTLQGIAKLIDKPVSFVEKVSKGKESFRMQQIHKLVDAFDNLFVSVVKYSTKKKGGVPKGMEAFYDSLIALLEANEKLRSW